jgi:alkaline phosphatase D
MNRWTSPSRRRVLQGGASFGGAALAGCAALPDETLRTSARLFSLGVASGDPLPDSVVLWTRLAPDPLNGGGMPDTPVPVGWEVAADDRFQRIVRSGTATASPIFAHSVHVEVQGLEPDRWYWYRFHANGETSTPGRTRTAPPPTALPSSFRFAFASCQHYEVGYYTAYRHMAAEDLDLVVHLGDYIYEGRSHVGRPRMHGTPTVRSLADYRNRYALYKRDPDLQAAHAAFPWSVVWDDHEVANNYAADRDQNDDVSPADFLKRRAVAYQAYYEHMPLRPAARPSGPDMRIYRRRNFGRLVTLNFLDTRQYRTNQPCNDGWKADCAGADDSRATMLGDRQEAWLEEGFANSRTAWNVLAQQVVIMQRKRIKDGAALQDMDSWSGYRVARSRLFDMIERHRPSGLVALTGDVHATWIGDLKRDFDDPSSATLGTELVGTSISSSGDGWDMRRRFKRMLAANPHIQFYNGRRGYLRCEVGKDQWRTDLRIVPYVSKPGAPIATLRSFVVDRRTPGVVVA